MNEIKVVSFPTIIGVAILVMAGCYGNGEERVERLEAEGYNYNKVQDCVNELYEIIEKYGD